MKMIMINVETMPPVVVVYSLSPLYRSSLLLGKRSTALKVPVAQEKRDGIMLTNNNSHLISSILFWLQLSDRFISKKKTFE